MGSDQSGTFVAQACLARLTDQSPALHSIVTSLQGKAGQLGSTQQGTFFLQKLVEVLGGETGPAYLLQEDILVNIGTLCMSEAGATHGCGGGDQGCCVHCLGCGGACCHQDQGG